jgi:hypothetical protein
VNTKLLSLHHVLIRIKEDESQGGKCHTKTIMSTKLSGFVKLKDENISCLVSTEGGGNRTRSGSRRGKVDEYNEGSRE